MGLQINTTYTLVGGDGTRCVFNDPNDPDYIGRIDPDQGITGLDSPGVRENADVLVEADGGVHGNFYNDRRPVTMAGWIHPDPVSESNRRIDKLQQAVNRSRRADATLRWTEDGSVERQLNLRVQQPTRITGRRPKTFLIALVSADHRIYSSALNSQVVPAAGSVSLSGFSFPISFPLTFGPGTGLGAGNVINYGSESSPPTFRIDGPITNPIVHNATTGLELRILYTLTAGQYLTIDSRAHTILLNGTTNQYSALDFTNSQWWQLEPGPNQVILRASAYATPAALTVSWRHAWI